jgi:hypothetical protein
MTDNWSSDDPIAAAARSLVQRDVPAGFGTRVLARLDRTPRATRWPWLAVPAAAAILAMWAVLPARDVDLPDVSRPVLVAARPPLPPSPAAIEQVAQVASEPVRPSPVRASTEAPAPAGALEPSPAEAAWRAAALPPLPTPEPIEVAVTQPAPVTIALLETEPLAVTRLAIVPLGSERSPREP